jgi:hypothetical protein
MHLHLLLSPLHCTLFCTLFCCMALCTLLALHTAAQKDAYSRELRDPAIARRAVHLQPQPQQQQQGGAEEVPEQIVASTRQPASRTKQAVLPPNKPAGEGAATEPAQQAVSAQQQVQHPAHQPGTWGRAWSILLG